jgi:hypothetical protein
MSNKGGSPIARSRIPDDVRMRLMIAAYLLNVSLADLADRLVVLDVRMKPEDVLAKLAAASEGGLLFAHSGGYACGVVRREGHQRQCPGGRLHPARPAAHGAAGQPERLSRRASDEGRWGGSACTVWRRRNPQRGRRQLCRSGVSRTPATCIFTGRASCAVSNSSRSRSGSKSPALPTFSTRRADRFSCPSSGQSPKRMMTPANKLRPISLRRSCAQ